MYCYICGTRINCFKLYCPNCKIYLRRPTVLDGRGAFGDYDENETYAERMARIRALEEKMEEEDRKEIEEESRKFSQKIEDMRKSL